MDFPYIDQLLPWIMPRIHPQLPVEILQSEVLPRLPAKSICRLRSVCKSWNSFLSTPAFARTHLRYQTNYKLLLLDRPSRTFRTLDCDDSITTRPIPFKDDVLILASLDGLVCVAFKSTRELAICNPLTGAYKKIRTSFYKDIRNGVYKNIRSGFHKNDFVNGALAFYTDSSNDYKLLHIASKGAFIYSRRLDSWRKINTCLESSHHISNTMWRLATFSGEKVYFKLVCRSTARPWSIMSFDVESEKFKEIQFPPFPCDASLYVNLVSLKGCIHLCVAYGDISKGLKCDMWRMDGDGWTKVATFASPHCNPHPLREIHTKSNGNWLAICKDNNSITNIGLEDFVTDLYYILVGHWLHKGAIHIETLLSPNP